MNSATQQRHLELPCSLLFFFNAFAMVISGNDSLRQLSFDVPFMLLEKAIAFHYPRVSLQVLRCHLMPACRRAGKFKNVFVYGGNWQGGER